MTPLEKRNQNLEAALAEIGRIALRHEFAEDTRLLNIAALVEAVLSEDPPLDSEFQPRLEQADRFLVHEDRWDPIHIEKMRQRDGSVLWAVRKGGRVCLTRDGHWCYEPMPSSRDENFAREFRYASYAEAVEHLERFGIEEHPPRAGE